MAWFLGGGIGSYVVLGTGVLVGLGGGFALLLAVVGWFFRPLRIVAKLAGLLAVVACLLPMIVGVGASTYARSQVRQALEFADPEMRDIIAARGAQEASVPTVLGGGLTCLVLIPGVLAAVVAFAIPAPKRDDDD